jgi:predicted metalloprotease with PDZ domain
MFGYNAPSSPTVDELQELLAHEIAHNWPSMQGEHGDTAWYSEGAAEYYSLVFAYRAGLLDRAALLREVNQRAGSYYTHPFRGLTNAEAAQRFWSDPFVQQVPYGRGFLYLAQTDAAIRRASRGTKSLDDVVRAIRARQQADQPFGIAQWLELVGAEIGRDKAERDYRRMTSGAPVPPEGAFGPCFTATNQPRPIFDLGFARNSLNDSATVSELRADSNAARAGLRNGDVILDYTDLRDVTADAAREMVLRIRRDGTEQEIRYLPRGTAVENWVFADDPAVPAERCRF